MADKAELPSMLLVENNLEDQAQFQNAFVAAEVPGVLHVAPDADAFLRHVQGRGGRPRASLPRVIVLDLDLPGEGSNRVLQTLKGDGRLFRIPVVVLTNSRESEDVARLYERGVNSYIPKPKSFAHLVTILCILRDCWFAAPQRAPEVIHAGAELPLPPL
jgi:two-component system, response regulator